MCFYLMLMQLFPKKVSIVLKTLKHFLKWFVESVSPVCSKDTNLYFFNSIFIFNHCFGRREIFCSINYSYRELFQIETYHGKEWELLFLHLWCKHYCWFTSSGISLLLCASRREEIVRFAGKQFSFIIV